LYWETGRKLPSEDADLCGDFFDVLDSSYLFQFVSVAVVVVINGIALPIIKAMVAFEKQVSVSAEKKALVSKMFSLQFMNTAIITLLVNTAYSGQTSLGFFTTLGVGKGEYDDFNMAWYINVGAGLCTTMLIQAASPHGGPIAKSYVIKPLLQTLTAKSASTQDQVMTEQPPPPHRNI